MAFSINGIRHPESLIENEREELEIHYRQRLAEEEYLEIAPKIPVLARENVVARILVEAAAFEADLEVGYAEVQAEFARMLEHFGGEAAFHERFEKTPDDHQGIKENIEKSLKVARFLDQVCGPVAVTDDEILAERERLSREGLRLETAEPGEIKTRVEGLVRERKRNAILKEYKAKLRKNAVVLFDLNESPA